MKKLVSNTGEYGPFVSIELIDTNYVCDGVIYPQSVVGVSGIIDYVPEEVVPEKYVPRQVTMRQARLALFARDKLAAVVAAIDNLPSPQKEQAQIEWEFSSTVERNRPLVQMLGIALGLTEDELDDLFIEASQL